MNINFKEVFKKWTPLAIAIVAMGGLVYIAVQQDLRISAYDPQIQLSEDIANQLALGADPTTYGSAQKTDIKKSLDSFIMVFDDRGNVLVSSATLNNEVPKFPSGVLDYTRDNKEDKLTWQPQKGIRQAIVVTRYKGDNPGFVVIGRSLREVEIRIDNLGKMTLLAMITTLSATLGAAIILEKLFPTWNKKPKR